MKGFGRMLGAFVIAASALSLPARAGADSLGAIRVGIVEGDVQVRIAETGAWVPVSINMPLIEGDELWVPYEGRAALQTSNGTHVRLGRGTALHVLRMDRDSFQFYLVQGRAYLLSLAPARSLIQLDTPDASVRSFGAATFAVDVLDGETDISVFKGSLLAESVAGTTSVRQGSMLSLGPRGYASLSPLPPPGEWARWNAQRDRIVLAGGDSLRYLPDELAAYAADFDGNGRWVFVREYGYCWTPRVLLIADWAPYRHGRWVWRGGHYVWIGYEPWGWVPYHYGRWAFVVGIGWCWVPPSRGDVYWGPGYVAWIHTADHVAWVPLAPRETYYGYGSYGRYSFDVTSRNARQVRASGGYRNVRVAGSITVVHHTTFVTGRPAPVDRRVAATVRDNFVQGRGIAPGRPRIQPAETSYVPVVRTVPEASRPPATVRRLDAKEVRQYRPLVREPDRSSLRPEERSRPLEPRKVERPRPAAERVREREPARPVSPRDPGIRTDGAPRIPEREIERSSPPAVPDRGREPGAPTPPQRRIEREGTPEPAERMRPDASRDDRERQREAVEAGRNARPQRGDPEGTEERVRPERPPRAEDGRERR
jgi:hypothetical protein